MKAYDNKLTLCLLSFDKKRTKIGKSPKSWDVQKATTFWGPKNPTCYQV